MKGWPVLLKQRGSAFGLAILLSSNSRAEAAGFKPTGHAELDAIRQSMASEQTNSENYKLRIFMLKQWIPSLQQTGANTEAALEVTEGFKTIFPWNLFGLDRQERPLTNQQQARLYPTIDRGYAILEAIYADCNPLTRDPVMGDGSAQDSESACTPTAKKEDWPLYQKSNQHEGSVETDYVLCGKKAWKFRMENRMEEACAAIYGNKLYLLSSGGWVYAVE